MNLPTVGGLPVLAIPAVVMSFLLVVALLILGWCHRRQKLSPSSSFGPSYLSHLASSLGSSGVSFRELHFTSRLLGKGSQGEVFLARWRGLEVAVKKVDTRAMPPEEIDDFYKEADMMRRLRHPSLTLFMGVSVSPPHLCIVTELVHRGSLFDLLRDDTGGFTWRRALRILADVASGMTYLHTHAPPILHRDLKSLNILIDENWRGKVADFGMTRLQSGGGGAAGSSGGGATSDDTMTQCGSPLWMAPEMIRGDPYDEKADVFSFAVVMWEVYTRQVPYRDLNLLPTQLALRVVRDHLRPTLPRRTPKKFARLLARCWHDEPKQRPRFAEIGRELKALMRDGAILRHRPTIGDETDDLTADEEDDDDDDDNDDDAPLDGPLADAARAQDALVAAHEEVARLASSSQASDNAWRILDPHEIRVTRTRILGHSETTSNRAVPGVHGTTAPTIEDNPDAPVNGAAARPHLVFRAQFRGTSVIVKRCRLTACTPGGGDEEGGGTTENDAGVTIPSDLSPFGPPGLSRLLQLAASARHPNLVLLMGACVFYDHVLVVEEAIGASRSLARLLSPTTPAATTTPGGPSNSSSTLSTRIEWSRGLRMLIDAASGLAAATRIGLVHPDLCPKRLLLTHTGRVKVASLGFVDLARRLDEWNARDDDVRARRGGGGGARRHTTGAGAAAVASRVYESRLTFWSAPETFAQEDPLAGLAYDARDVKDARANVYSFALIMWSLVTRRTPFDGRFHAKLKQRIVDGHRPPMPGSISPRFQSLIRACWSPSPSSRPSFESVVSELEGILADGPPVLQLDETNSRRYRRAATVFAHASRDPVTVMKDTGKSRGPSPCVVVASPTRAPPTLKRRGSRTTTTSLSESESDELLAYYSSFTELTACDSDAFSRAYEPAGTPHQHEYRRRGRVRARCMEEPFAVATRVGGVRGAEGDVKTPSSFEDASLTIEHGEAGDYLVQNDAGDQWVTDARSMAVAYCVAPEDDAMEEEEVDEEETTTTTTTAATTPREGNTSQHETPRGGTTAAAFALLTPAVPPLGYASTHRTTSPATLHVNRLSGGGLLSPTVSLAPSPTSSTLTGGGFFASSRTGTTTSTPVASAPPTPRKKTNAVASATTTTTTTTTPILKKCAVTRDTAAVADRPTITRAGIVTRAQEDEE